MRSPALSYSSAQPQFHCVMSQVAISAPAHPPILDDEYARRFGGVARLYGPQALERFAAAHVCVIGIGGVGSWAAEALARCGVGKLTLIDLDHIAVSNTNRQIHALGDAYGMAKVDAMAERILQINPRAEISRIDDFVTVENVEGLLGYPFDYVVDAIDAVKVKTAIVAFCKRTGKRVVTCGAAGGQLDPTRIRVTDLSRTIQDPLLAKVRGNLRRQHGFRKTRKPSSASTPCSRTSRCVIPSRSSRHVPSRCRRNRAMPASMTWLPQGRSKSSTRRPRPSRRRGRRAWPVPASGRRCA